MRLLYTLLHYLAIPIVLLRLWLKSRHNTAYRQRWLERFGHIKPIKAKKSIWLHAVSLGESIAASPLIEKILAQYPTTPLVVTTTTPTGSTEIQKRFGNSVLHYYAPFDLPHVVSRFLKRAKPTQVITMETELWPNLLHQLKRNKIPTMVANARLSQRSMQNYLRFRHTIRPLIEPLTIAAQSKADGDRFKTIGARKNNISVSGNIKFDYPVSEAIIGEGQALRRHWQKRPTLIAASTHEGEEKIILDAFTQIRKKISNALLILVPRHPERFSKVATLCKNQGFSLAKRSANQLPNDSTALILGDRIGELRLLYTTSDVAFVGGSLVPIGGHNLIEPASLSLPILTGPHLHNFNAIGDMLEEAEALLITPNANSIASAVIGLFRDESRRHQLGARALGVSDQNQGAINHHMALLDPYLAPLNNNMSEH